MCVSTEKDLEPHQCLGERRLGLRLWCGHTFRSGQAWWYLGDMTFVTLQRKGLMNGEGECQECEGGRETSWL